MNIIFFDAKPYDRAKFLEANESFGFSLVFHEERLSMDNVHLTKGFDVVCIFVRDRVTEEIIDRLAENGVKMIALRCAGYDNVDFSAIHGRLRVVHVPAYSPHAIAEFAVTLMLALNRKVHLASNRTRRFDFSLDGLQGFDMNGKTVGMIGTGKIAKIAIRILRGFGCRVLAHDIYPDELYAKETGFRYTSLDELYENSDIISLHTPLTEATKYMINRDSIARMKKGVMLINTGRGQLVHSGDLLDGLKRGHIGAAGLDVYDNENDYFYEDLSHKGIEDNTLKQLLAMPNVIVTSHQAFLTAEALGNIAATTLESCNELRLGKPLTYELKQT